MSATSSFIQFDFEPKRQACRLTMLPKPYTTSPPTQAAAATMR